MTTSFLRVVLALFALTFIVAACASDTGALWTYAPVTASETAAEATQPAAETAAGETAAAEVAAEATAPAEASPGEASPGDAAATDAAAEPEVTAPAAAAGEPRVIEIQADAALRLTDASGAQLTDIPVTPGETVLFRVDNTAGFPHDFWIGTDNELMVPYGTTDTGIPQWSSGVEEFEWVVPDDITGLKYGCTVPGHYALMQGTFSVGEPVASAANETATPSAEPADEPATPSAEPADESATASAEPADESATASGEPADESATASGESRIIELEADAALRFLQNGEQIREIPVTPGESVIFRVDNTAGFPHNFWIGSDAELSVPYGTTDTGITDWETGIQEVTWVVPENLDGVRFGCTVPGHYILMHGDFVVSS